MDQFKIYELSVTAAIVGIIWIIQLLHYPSFQFYKAENFRLAMKHHQDRISLVIVPLMLTELALAVFGVVKGVSSHSLAMIGIVGLVWIITFTVHVPLHAKLLQEGFNEERIKRLVITNWSRTLLWTMKLGLIFT